MSDKYTPEFHGNPNDLDFNPEFVFQKKEEIRLVKGKNENLYNMVTSEHKANKDLQEQLEQQAKSIAELKKKRSKGEINEAYAKTIEANRVEISRLKSKINKLTQKLNKTNKQNK